MKEKEFEKIMVELKVIKFNGNLRFYLLGFIMGVTNIILYSALK